VNLSELYLTNLDLSGLTTVGSNFLLGGGESGAGPLAVISLPSLIEVGGELSYWAYSGELETMSLPNLVSVGGFNFTFSEVDQLTMVDFSSLETAGSLNLNYYSAITPPTLPLWRFSALADVANSFTMYMTGAVTNIQLPLLESVGSLYIDIYSDALETIEFPVLTESVGDLYVANTSTNAKVLSSVDFGSLIQVATQGASFSAATFQTPTNALDIGQFVGVGADYSGTITLNVAPFDVCADAVRIVSAPTFIGVMNENYGCF
jgi:hypothetical protein